MRRASSLLPEPVGPMTATSGFSVPIGKTPLYNERERFYSSGHPKRGRREKVNTMIRTAKTLVMAGVLASLALAQQSTPAADKAASDKAAAYYNFAMGHL